MEYKKDSMTRRKLTALIVAGALAVAGVSMVLFKRSEMAAAQTPATTPQDGDAKRPAGPSSPAQIEQVPRYSQDVFMPPPSNATGASPLPPPARK
jgi:hypothetical protein